MTLQAEFRPMTVDDLAQVAEIDRLCYPFPWTVGNFSDALHAGYRCCVWANHSHVFAYAVAMAIIDELHLLNLTVVLEQQGLGYGRGMLSRLLRCAQHAHFRSMWLEVRPSNLNARMLYDNMGFVLRGVRKNYYPAENGREDALVMSLEW